jgi:pullulanase/glycogen debranching enzyme
MIQSEQHYTEIVVGMVATPPDHPARVAARLRAELADRLADRVDARVRWTVREGWGDVAPRRDGAWPGTIGWFTPQGTAMTQADWTDPLARAVTAVLDGQAQPDRNRYGRPMFDDDLLALVNGWWEPIEFALPPGPDRPGDPAEHTWRLELDTAAGVVRPAETSPHPWGGRLTVQPRSHVLLASHPPVTAASS